MRVLIVEDDLTIAGFLMKGFKEAGFAVDHAADGETGLHLATTEPYDVAIVDLMLPRLDGLSLIQRMREKKIRTPVIILSAKHSVDDRVKGLQTGGDDYLTKPFAFSELLARVQALIRRATGVTDSNRLVVGDLIAGSDHQEDHPRGARHRGTAAARVRAAGVLDAQRRTRGVENDDPVARLELQLRSAHERR